MISIQKGNNVAIILGDVVAGNVVFNVGNKITSNITKIVEGSGIIHTQERPITEPFNRLKVSGVATVEVKQAPEISCTVSADDNVVEMVTTVVDDGILVVGFKGSATLKSPIKVSITSPDIKKFSFSGSGKLHFTSIDMPKLRGTISGSGTIDLAGKVDDLRLNFSGSGSADASRLQAINLELGASGSGSIIVCASDSADIMATGVSKVLVAGNPIHRNVQSSGLAKIKWV